MNGRGLFRIGVGLLLLVAGGVRLYQLTAAHQPMNAAGLQYVIGVALLLRGGWLIVRAIQG